MWVIVAFVGCLYRSPQQRDKDGASGLKQAASGTGNLSSLRQQQLLERLERDFNGMVRYKSLLEQNKVSAPVVSDARLGTTGTGQDMRVNDRAIRITRDPSLKVDAPKDWQAAPTTPGPNGTTTGSTPPKPQTKPSAERPKVSAHRPSANRRVWDGRSAPSKAVPTPVKATPAKAAPAAPETF